MSLAFVRVWTRCLYLYLTIIVLQIVSRATVPPATSDENVSFEASEPHSGEMLEPLPPRPVYISPGQASVPSEAGPKSQEKQPAKGPVNSGQIVFPSD